MILPLTINPDQVLHGAKNHSHISPEIGCYMFPDKKIVEKF